MFKLEEEPSGEHFAYFYMLTVKYVPLSSFYCQEVHGQFVLWITFLAIVFIPFSHLCSKFNASGKTLEVFPLIKLFAHTACLLLLPHIYTFSQPPNCFSIQLPGEWCSPKLSPWIIKLPHLCYINYSDCSPKIMPLQICFSPWVDLGRNESISK